MKFPKLRQTALCNFVLFLPLILCFLPLILIGFGDYGVFGLLVFPGMILALVYIFKNFAFLMLMDFTLGTIKAQKKDAEEFRTDKNGKTREEIERRFIIRCESLGKKESAILDAEAEKTAAILRAEAQKEKMIREAEGEAAAILKVQQANADGIRMIREAGADEKVLQIKSLEALEKVAEGESTKIIIPSDLQGVASLATTFKEVISK